MINPEHLTDRSNHAAIHSIMKAAHSILDGYIQPELKVALVKSMLLQAIRLDDPSYHLTIREELDAQALRAGPGENPLVKWHDAEFSE